MKRCVIAVLISLVVLFVTATLTLQSGQSVAADTGWLSDVDAGFKEALRTGKPLLVMFRCVP